MKLRGKIADAPRAALQQQRRDEEEVCGADALHERRRQKRADDSAQRSADADEAEEREWVLTCCIITTAANALMAPLHERMPVMLPPDHWAAWLDRGNTEPAALAPLMQGLPAGAMQAWPVARTVGRSSADGAGLVEPLADSTMGRPPDRPGTGAQTDAGTATAGSA